MVHRRSRDHGRGAASPCRPTSPIPSAITFIFSTIRGPSAVIVSTEKLLRPLHGALQASGVAEHVIGIEDLHRQQSGSFEFHTWAKMLEGDAAAARKAVDQRIAVHRSRATPLASSTPAAPAARRAACKQHHGAILCNAAGRGGNPDRGFRDRRRRTLPVLPAAEPRLRAYRRAVPADRRRRADLLCRRARKARQQYRGNPADHHGGGPAPVRSAAHADHEANPQAGRYCRNTHGYRARSRRAARRRRTQVQATASRNSRSRAAEAEDPPALRRTDEGDGVGRRAAQSRGRRLLRGDGADHAAGLRPDRGRAGDQLQPARRGDRDGHGRPADARRGIRIAEDGEILVPRRAGDARLLAERGRNRAHHQGRLAAYGRHRPSRRPGPDRDHRSQEGHDRQRQGRQHRPAEGRGHAHAAARDRPGDGGGRQAALCRRADRSRRRMDARMVPRAGQAVRLQAAEELPEFNAPSAPQSTA